MTSQEAAAPNASAPAGDEERALVAGLKGRLDDAWTALYNSHYQALFRYAYVRTSDVHIAEDLASAAFLEALKGIDSYQPRGKPILAWLYRIERNLVSDHFKAARSRPLRPFSSLPEGNAGAIAPVLGEGRPLGAADPAALVPNLDLRDALRALKEPQREVIVLHYYVGLTLPQVALLLGKKDRAVYSLHARAVEALRRALEGSTPASSFPSEDG